MAGILWRQTLALLRERPGRMVLILGGIVFALGTVFIDRMPRPQWLSHAIVLEDGFEMIASSLILYALLLKLGNVEVRITGGSDEHGADDADATTPPEHGRTQPQRAQHAAAR